MHPLFSIQKLSVQSSDKKILSDVSLDINAGEIHIIMGPNGSGKSTLCQALLGHPKYEISKGTILFEGKNITDMKTHDRAKLGVFLGFQYPREIPGVSLGSVLRTAKHATLKAAGKEKEYNRKDFIASVKQGLENMNLSQDFAKRALNDNASGGEKKRLEMTQLAVLNPKLAILDEIDSGVDIDALKLIAGAIEKQRTEQHTAFLIVTHYQRLLDYIKPDRIHVLVDGKIVKTGGAELAHELEKEGYKKYEKTDE